MSSRRWGLQFDFGFIRVVFDGIYDCLSGISSDNVVDDVDLGGANAGLNVNS